MHRGSQRLMPPSAALLVVFRMPPSEAQAEEFFRIIRQFWQQLVAVMSSNLGSQVQARTAVQIMATILLNACALHCQKATRTEQGQSIGFTLSGPA